MKLIDWHVMEDSESKKREYLYGPLTDYDEDDLEGMVEIPSSDWSVEDMCQITSNLLEDVNMHKCTIHPEMILRCCESSNMDDNMKWFFIFNYMHEVFDQYEY